MVTIHPIKDSRTVTRERVFQIVAMRADFQDVVAQVVFTLAQLHNERVTGKLEINFSQGSVTNTKLVEQVK